MKCIFALSGDYIELAKEEILGLFDVQKYNLLDWLLIADIKNNEKNILKLSERLALTKSIYKLLFECNVNDSIKTVRNFDWNSVYRDNFCLRVNILDNKNKAIKDKIKNNKNKKNNRATSESIRAGSNPLAIFSEKNLAKYVWRSVNNPKVELENPVTSIHLFITKNKAYCGLLACENKEDFESRKAHLRPFPHPSSLHPKIARSLVNITGIMENELLLDPFCGTGGFLIEAGLMNIKTIGYDIYKKMSAGCKKNLDYYKIKRYKIKNKNALEIKDKFDCVVTDLPYGLNSNVLLKYEKGIWKQNRLNKKIQKKNFIKNIEKFYLAFLKQLRRKLRKKAVIVFPDYVDYRKLLKSAKFRIEKEFSIYVHRSLTRKIVKITKI